MIISLKQNTDGATAMTTYQDAYDMGYKAFKEGAYRNDNPFDKEEEPLLNEGWTTGFIDAREEHY